MYPEYDKIRTIADDLNLLLNSSMTMKSLYELSIIRNAKNTYAYYVNAKGKIDSYSYKEFNLNTLAIAKKLSEILKKEVKNVPVILKLANSPHWCEVYFAILMCGYKPVLVDARLGKENTENLINQSHSVAIISDDVYEYDVIKIALEDIKPDKHTKKHVKDFVPHWEDEVIFCSSGTTGEIKLMVFNGQNLCYQVYSAYNVPEESKDLMYPMSMGKLHILAMLPLHHIFGFVAVFLWFTFFGKTLVFPASIATKDLLSICQKCGVTHIFSVPLLWDSVVQAVTRQVADMNPDYPALLEKIIAKNVGENPEKLDLKEKIFLSVLQKKLVGSKVRYAISGGGYLSEKTSRFINGLGYPLYNGYGMTEIGVTSVELAMDPQERLKCYIGHAFKGVEYKVVPSNESTPNLGELCIRSKIVHVREIIGGVEQPSNLDEDGYFHSGDIVSIDEKTGKVLIKGRIKDIILNANGENVFPDEIEFYFKKVNHVTNVCVLGVKHGNTPHDNIALVLEVENTTTDEEYEKLKEEVNNIAANLPKGTTINEIYISKGKLPLSSAMKVKRFVVKKAIEEKSPDFTSMNAKVEVKTFEGVDPEIVESIREPIRDAVSKILYIPKFKIKDSGHWINDLGGDSMSYVELLQFVEEHFDVKIPEELYGKLSCIDEFVEEIIKLKYNNDNSQN